MAQQMTPSSNAALMVAAEFVSLRIAAIAAIKPSGLERSSIVLANTTPSVGAWYTDRKEYVYGLVSTPRLDLACVTPGQERKTKIGTELSNGMAECAESPTSCLKLSMAKTRS